MNIAANSTGSFVNQLNWQTNQSTKALERLASGSRLLAPQDDAAGLAVATRLEAKLRQFDAAGRNIANAISFSQTQDGFLSGAQDVLNRMGSLAIRAQDATLSDEQRALFQDEFQDLKDTFNNLRTAQFNGRNLFDGDEFVVAASPDSPVVQGGDIDLFSDQISAVTANKTQLFSHSEARDALKIITEASELITHGRIQAGSTLSELEMAGELLFTERFNAQTALSKITAPDIAAETINLVREQIFSEKSNFYFKNDYSMRRQLVNILS